MTALAFSSACGRSSRLPFGTIYRKF